MSEYLSKDILEEPHIKSFAPFRLFQIAFGSCRVDVRDRFVTPPSVLQKLYSIFVITVSLILYITFTYLNYSNIMYPSLYALCVVGVYLNFVIYFLNIFDVRFLFNDENVRFYIKMLEIDRKLKIDTKPYMYDVLHKLNSVTVLVWSSFVLLLACLSLINDYERALYSIGLICSRCTWTVELMHYSNLILYFYTRVRFVNTIIINHLNLNDEFYVLTYDILKFLDMKALRVFAAETNNFLYSDTVEYLTDIFDALRTFTILYRFQMFLFCFKIVAYSITFVEFFILAAQKNIKAEQERVALPIIVLGDLVMLISICVRWESFFGEIEETKHLCTTVLAKYKQGPLRKKAAKMIKVIEETPPCFSVYDMWNMDASTLFKILNIITNVIVTLFQFALL